MQKVTFVYRGSNPFLRRLAAAISGEAEVEIREVPNAEQIGELDSTRIVISDETLFFEVTKKIGRDPIDAYDFLKATYTKDALVGKLRSIVNEVRSKGKVPVGLESHLGDHINEKLVGEQMREGKDCYYSSILRENFGIPIISTFDFYFDIGSPLKGCVSLALETRGMKTNDVVLLVDHHIYNVGRKIPVSGLTEVEIIPICPCCIGRRTGTKETLQDCGFKLFELECEQEVESAIESLRSKLATISS